MWDSLLSFLSLEKRYKCFFFFFITSRVLKVVLNGQYCTWKHGFVQSRHPGWSFWWKSCQPWKCKGRLEGWGPLLTTEAKNMAFYFGFWFFCCALIHCKPSLVQQNSSKDNTAQGKSKHCWLDRCGNIALVHWWHVVKKELKCTFLLMEARQEMSRGGDHM